MLKYLGGLLLIFASAAVSAATPGDQWLEVHSAHFVVLTNSNEKQARHVAGQFERMRAVFHTLFPAAADDPGSPVVVVALKDKKSFQALEPADYLSKGQLDLAGLFLRTPDKNYVLLRLDATGEHPYAIVYHEYTHYMLRSADAWMPLWLNEGLAEFYQNTDIDSHEVRLGQPSADDIYYLRQNALLPLTTLLRVDYSSPYYHEEEKGSMFYSESWALTHYLLQNDNQRKTHRIQDYTQLMMQHEDPVAAAQQAFGDLKKLELALTSYVRQDSFVMFMLNTPATVNEASFQVQPIPTPQADAIRADVLVSDERTKDAQALLDEVLREDPKNAQANETMGLLKFREGDISGAKQWFGHAVALDSNSYLAHYYYAVMSLQADNGHQDDAIESSLRAAIKLNPNFAPSYDALAMFYASRHQKLEEAHLLNVQAVSLEPDNLNYRLNAAEVFAENQEFANALRILKAAAPVAKTPAETALVETRIKEIEQYQASLDRAQKESSAAARTTVTTFANGGTVTVAVPAAVAGLSIQPNRLPDRATRPAASSVT